MSKWLSIGEIVESVSITHKFDKPKLKFLNTADAEKGKIVNYTELPISELKGQAKKTIQKDDILFSEVRPKNKHYAYVDIEDCSDYVVSTKLMVLRKFNDNVNNKYFYYSLINDKMLDILQSRAENRICSFPQITFDLLSEYKIRIPEISEQESIAHILEIIDKKIELNNKINSEFERIAKTLYDYWFVQFDFPDKNERPYKSSGGKMIYNDILKREIPENWTNGTLSDISSTQTGYAFKSCDWKDKGHPVLTIKVIENNSINMSEASFIENYQEKYSKYSVENGNIILAMTGNTIGKIGIIASDIKNILINQRVCIYKTNYSNIAYLYFNLLSEGIQNKIWQIGQNSSQPNISEEQLKQLPIVLPPNELLNKYNKIFGYSFERIVKNNIENQQLSKLRDFLLPMLMNGQVTIQQ